MVPCGAWDRPRPVLHTCTRAWGVSARMHACAPAMQLARLVLTQQYACMHSGASHATGYSPWPPSSQYKVIPPCHAHTHGSTIAWRGLECSPHRWLGGGLPALRIARGPAGQRAIASTYCMRLHVCTHHSDLSTYSSVPLSLTPAHAWSQADTATARRAGAQVRGSR